MADSHLRDTINRLNISIENPIFVRYIVSSLFITKAIIQASYYTMKSFANPINVKKYTSTYIVSAGRHV